jgi:ribosome-associated protein YbcJ (S4-like RNA binding protein)/cold shock CspA family protein
MDPGSVDTTFGLVQRDVRIRGETISLGQLLKLEGVIGSGAEIKRFLSTEPVWVNGETETRRGRKLRLDDVVRVGELELRLTSADLDIRRPQLRGVRRPGVVRWYSDDKGYGRITADDGEVLFVHFTDIEGEGYRSLEQGQRVSFVWNGGIQDHGRHHATEVRAESQREEGRSPSR